jgi:hypothetical protein
LQGCVDWLLAGPRPQPDDIQNELLQQRTSKTKTLVVAILASLLIASIAAALTGAAWAYAWILAELVLGSTRIYLMMKSRPTGRGEHHADLGRVGIGYPDFRRLLSMRRIGGLAAGLDGRHRTCESGRRNCLA